LLAAGAQGDQVRELQARLKQLKSYAAPVDGVFAASTTDAVKDFQNDFDLVATGAVDEDMWKLLVATTATPSAEELAGHLIAGPALLKNGSTGALVRELQARLKQLGRWSGDVTSTYGSATSAAVKGYQKKRGLPETGEVDQRTKDRIWSQTRKPTSDELNNVKPAPAPGLTTSGLDPRCLTGRVICASKATVTASSRSSSRTPTSSRSSTRCPCRCRCSSAVDRPSTTPPTSPPTARASARTVV
jgi:peptidoglycan hydrolase-like protein with peptidoglycan-binding domain